MENKDYITEIPNAERRYFVTDAKTEKRSIGEGEEMQEEYYITGYAAKFNSETDLGYLREIIMPGAFDECLQDDVRALKNHDENMLLGRTKSKTAEIGVDGIGLWYRVRLDNRNTDHMNLYYSVERGDISESSFAFVIKEQSFEKGDGTKNNLRKIVKVEKLYDVSPVTYPAYQNTSINTSVALRSMKDAIQDEAPAHELETIKRAIQILSI
jgi:HK97 family phage prohead protease